MRSEPPISKSDFAELCEVTRSTVSHWISEGKIHGEAIVGQGRAAKIVPSIAKRQLRMSLDVGQRLGNGAGTRLKTPARGSSTPPASADPGEADGFDPALDEQIKREKLSEIQGRNRKAKEEELARKGRYTLTEDVRREMNALAARLVSGFESALTDFAADIAHRHKSDQRDEFLALAKVFNVWRAGMAERAKKAAAALPEFVHDPMEQEPA